MNNCKFGSQIINTFLQNCLAWVLDTDATKHGFKRVLVSRVTFVRPDNFEPKTQLHMLFENV